MQNNSPFLADRAEPASVIIEADEDILDSIDKILECAICLRLVAEPITIPCGHTFCRCCLVKTLQQPNMRKCPTCRAVCQIVAESAEESMMIKKLAIKRSPQQYQLRVREAVEERANWQMLLPAFIFPDVLFAGSRLDLFLFEPRYRLMMKRVCDSSTLPKFVYVPVSSNREKLEIALVAHVKDVNFLPSGTVIKGEISCRNCLSVSRSLSLCLSRRPLAPHLLYFSYFTIAGYHFHVTMHLFLTHRPMVDTLSPSSLSNAQTSTLINTSSNTLSKYTLGSPTMDNGYDVSTVPRGHFCRAVHCV